MEEISFYEPLAGLLNEAGRGLRPKVRCILSLRNAGVGIPDGGFFTSDQFRRGSEAEPAAGQLPSRGALEVKGIDAEVLYLAGTEQVGRYVTKYGQVLVTNLRDFALVTSSSPGDPRVMEIFRSAPDRDSFIDLLHHPTAAAERRGDALLDYLRRVLLRPAPLADPKDLAWFLASYAREARSRVEGAELPALITLRESLEGSLGIRFEGERGDHFFRSTLVQTLFYGVFSAWVLWSRHGGSGRFNWHESAWNLRVPMIRALFHQVADPDRLQKLGLVEILDWAGEVLNRVDREAFFTRFEEHHAVQYFYEPFLEAFDPELRKQLGVWYTPPEVVKYMVAKVDHALRADLGIEDGLADPRVVVLDPCCGTGTYLVEVLRRIGDTLGAKGDNGLVAGDVRVAATKRVFGFDIMPAPFVVAHLQLGLVLEHLGVPLGADERAGIYLTNALRGWIPAEGPKEQIPIALPELAAERDRAEHVKRDEPILVVLGNPPYNTYPAVAVGEERALTEAYRTTEAAPSPEGRGLNDLYVRFFRMAERRITEAPPAKGVVCFVSNYSWLDGRSFTGMRETYLDRFQRIDIDCLNGDKYRTGKLTPDGQPDPSIFSSRLSREGIQVGTAIATLVRTKEPDQPAWVRHRHLWGKGKLEQLADEASRVAHLAYSELTPWASLGYPYAPGASSERYPAWPRLLDLFPFSQPGVFTARDEVLVAIDREALLSRMERYFDAAVPDSVIEREMPRAMHGTSRFDGPRVRAQLVERGFKPEWLVPVHYRPYDLRWLYWEKETKLLDERRPEYAAQLDAQNVWLAAVAQNRKGYSAPPVCRAPASLHLIERGATLFPLRRRVTTPAAEGLFAANGGARGSGDEPGAFEWNLSESAAAYLQSVASTPDDAPHLFHYAIAILHAPAYRQENEGALRQDWPRIPLPAKRDALLESAALGRQVAALLDPEARVPGVTTGTVRAELRPVALIKRVDGRQLDAAAGDLDVGVRWGYAGVAGATMPGPGRAEERAYSEDEKDMIAVGAEALGLAPDEAIGLLGDTTFDVFLNKWAAWRCIPSRVWEYSLGGYQVIKKWLSYREKALLGRGLRADDAREVTNIARRIAGILLMGHRLDRNYRRCASEAGSK